jgi:serine/threonine protein kinase
MKPGQDIPAARRGASATGAPSVEDEAVIRAVQGYLAALQAGQRPDRQALLDRFPEVAPALADCLEGLDLLEQAAPSLGEAGGPPLPPPPSTGPRPTPLLGDFRLAREVGRGGMGVVYEAEQVSLGRRVALKVLPFAAALDARQLQRFRNEAQAAGCLHHGHIVPVYGVGCERGVHYYAMQFIEGQSLAELIGQLRQQAGSGSTDTSPAGRAPAPAAAQAPGPTPTGDMQAEARAGRARRRPAGGTAYFRTVAGLCAQAAEALEYAHQLGVIHRDVKPANLLVDGRGHLWVTDFGLAHVRSDVPLTLTGELVGTLRYMSPEQAKARPGVVDHRTDVYALGATLYELLTLEPVLRGQDVHELLHQIAFEEPRPPRRLDPTVPADLETIALKALAKDPAERYPTAQELADDLRRVLEDRPIRARRATPLQRLAKWSRRHRPLVAAGLAVLLVALVASLVSSFLIFQAYRAETAASEEAEDKSRRLKTTLKRAFQALDEIYLQVAEERLPREGPAEQAADRKLLLKARGFYEQFAQENRTNAEVQHEVCRVYFRMAEIDSKLGRLDQAREGFRRARDIAARLAADVPDDPEIQFDLGRTYVGLIDVANARGDRAALQAHCGRALEIFSELAVRYPAVPRYLSGVAKVHDVLGDLAKQDGDNALAIDHFRKALAKREKTVSPGQAPRDRNTYTLHRNLAHTVKMLGLSLTNGGGDPKEAVSCFRRACQLLRKLREQDPDDMLVLSNLGSTYENWARLLGNLRQPKEQERLLRRSVACYQEVIARHPNEVGYYQDLAQIENALAELLKDQDRGGEAQKHLARAIQHAKRVLAASPEQYVARSVIARARVYQGDILAAEGKPAEAEWAYRSALERFEMLVRKTPDIAGHADGLGESCFALAGLLVRSGRGPEAKQLCRRILDRAPDSTAVHNELAWRLATCPEPELRDPKEAIRRAKKAIAARPDDADFWNTLGAAYYRAGDCPAALGALDRSMRLNQGGHCGDWFFVAMARWQRGEKKQARRWYARAVHDLERKTPPGYDAGDLRRIRAEAAALLGEPLPAPPKSLSGQR